jgi:asparagine synthase (glutamine-hydrolysing)
MGAGPSPVCVIDGAVGTGKLAAELGLDSAAPAETVVAVGYSRLGVGVLEHLGGQYALVLWDAERSRGLIARDPLAMRPVFLAEHGGALLFASEVRNLLALLPSRPGPDPEAMGRWLARTPMTDDRTLFAGIRRLAGGDALRLEGGRWERIRALRRSYSRPRDLTPEEGAPLLRAALGKAVARALDGAERPAVMLSGGFDSAAVAAVAVAERPDAAPAAYSGVFPDHPAVDESERIRAVRARLGLPGVELEAGPGSALAGAIEFMRAWELPSVAPNRFIWVPLLRRATADGVDVMLDGEGGDEVLGGSPYVAADRLRSLRPLAALAAARRIPGVGTEPPPRRLARALLIYGARGALPERLHARLRSARGRTAGPPWMARPVAEERWEWKRTPGARAWAHLLYLLTADSVGAGDQMRREAALHGLEARHPLRDPELVDLVLSLPPELALHPELDRPLARAALANELPEAILGNVRKPFFNEILDASLAGPDAGPLRALLSDPHPDLAVLVRRGAAAALLDPPAGEPHPAGWAVDLWRIASLELWLRHQADPNALNPLLERLAPPRSPRFRDFEAS